MYIFILRYIMHALIVFDDLSKQAVAYRQVRYICICLSRFVYMYTQIQIFTPSII